MVPSAYQLATLDENLAAVPQSPGLDLSDESPTREDQDETRQPSPAMIYYSAAGSGVAEVRVILSGFVLHGFLGFKTIIIKSAALVLSVASGLSLGKEGPYVHIAACVGNIACRLFPKYDRNDAKRREVLSAAAAAGVAVAFGAPLGGVLFGLEEVAYFFPAKTLFRTFFCCIIAALSLKFLNPYGTHKIVMFQVRFLVDWEYFELASFVAVGILGGALGALFIKASKFWAQTFRSVRVIKSNPLFEVFSVALVTGLLNYWNALVKQPVAKLLLNLASPCDGDDANLHELGLCPKTVDDIPPILLNLVMALFIKGFLTVITFGIVSVALFRCLPRPSQLKLTMPAIESASWDLHPVHGSRRLDGSHYWASSPVVRFSRPRMGHFWQLFHIGVRILYSTRSLCIHRRWSYHVWRHKTFSDVGSNPLRADGQFGLCSSLLLDNTGCQMDGRCH